MGEEVGEQVITMDTSALVALMDRREARHEGVRSALFADTGPYLLPAAILSEVAYLIELRVGSHALDPLLGDLEDGLLSFECGEEDMGRVRALVTRYADLPLGLSDAAVIACGERNGGKVLTLDRRDFDVVAREGAITLLP